MPFFNLRRGSPSSQTTTGPAAPAESLEIVRKRAKHRLIGSAVLVLLGVIGFPLLFDTQPRPVSVNIPIEIPSKQGARPLGTPSAGEGPAPAAAVTAPEAASVTSPPQGTASTTAPAVPAPAPVSSPAPAPAPAPVSVPAPAPAPASAVASSGSASVASQPRLVVQVGAFADVAKAREARLKLERAGLKTYTQVAETKDGKRIRVRVGPYATKAEADKAAKQIRALELPAAILTL